MCKAYQFQFPESDKHQLILNYCQNNNWGNYWCEKMPLLYLVLGNKPSDEKSLECDSTKGKFYLTIRALHLAFRRLPAFTVSSHQMHAD